jgi:hypothetical protein
VVHEKLRPEDNFKAVVSNLAEGPNTELLTSHLEGMEIEAAWRPEDKLKALVGGPTEAMYKNLPLTRWDVGNGDCVEITGQNVESIV